MTTGTFGLQNPKVFRTGWVKSNKKAVCLRTALWKGPQAKSTSVTLPAFREQNRELILLRIEDANCAGTVAGKSVFFKKGQNIEDQTLNYFTCSGLEPAKLSLKYTYYENGILKRGEVSSQEFTPSFAITSDILKP